MFLQENWSWFNYIYWKWNFHMYNASRYQKHRVCSHKGPGMWRFDTFHISLHKLSRISNESQNKFTSSNFLASWQTTFWNTQQSVQLPVILDVMTLMWRHYNGSEGPPVWWMSTQCFMHIMNSVSHGPLARYVKLWVAHAPGMPGTFSPLSRVSDPDMRHGTCVTHVPWCMPGSLTIDFLWNR